MGVIRRLNIFDKGQLRKIAGLTSLNSDYFKYNLLKECASFTQEFLPLKFKFIPESYVLVEDRKIRGMISVTTTHGNYERINITRLLFENNDYESGKKLINFIVRHYGELGAKTFKVVIDNTHKDLEHLFIDGCGFRCCSYENLWDISHDLERFKMIDPIRFTTVTDGHAQMLSELTNGELVNYYRPTLEQTPNEFKEALLKIFNNKTENNYVLIRDNNAIAHLTIQSNDNENFIISLTKNNGYQLDYDAIISFALNRIKAHRSRGFKAYLKQKKYLKFAQEFEEYLHAQKYDCIQTQHVLVKEFYKPIKQEYKAFAFGENKLFSN